MSDGSSDHETPTRRDAIRYGGAVIGGGLLTGCIGQSNSMSPLTEATTNDSSTATRTTELEVESYSVTMALAGTIELDEVPKSVFTASVHHADMVVAFDHGGALSAMYSPSNSEGNCDKLLERLNGVSVDWSNPYNSWNPDKKTLYELDSNLHPADPAYVLTMDVWDTADVEEIQTEVAPWLGNSLSRNHSKLLADWADQCQYHPLWDIFGKVAQVFREQERYEVLSDVKTTLNSTILPSLPAGDNWPQTVRTMTTPELGTIWTFHMDGPGSIRSHTRPFGIPDALSDVEENSMIDLETPVEIDPEVIFIENTFARSNDWRVVKNEFHNDPVAGEILVVKDDQVYPLSARYGGLIMNLFQLEMVSKQLYPEQFGEWPGYDGGPYPDSSKEEQLFNREQIANITNGGFQLNLTPGLSTGRKRVYRRSDSVSMLLNASRASKSASEVVDR